MKRQRFRRFSLKTELNGRDMWSGVALLLMEEPSSAALLLHQQLCPQGPVVCVSVCVFVCVCLCVCVLFPLLTVFCWDVDPLWHILVFTVLRLESRVRPERKRSLRRRPSPPRVHPRASHIRNMPERTRCSLLFKHHFRATRIPQCTRACCATDRCSQFGKNTQISYRCVDNESLVHPLIHCSLSSASRK